MRTLTLAEQFADWVAGKYSGRPGALWNLLADRWGDDDVTDAIGDRYEEVFAVIRARDPAAMLAVCDWAEEAGAPTELCGLTRRALRANYPV